MSHTIDPILDHTPNQPTPVPLERSSLWYGRKVGIVIGATLGITALAIAVVSVAAPLSVWALSSWSWTLVLGTLGLATTPLAIDQFFQVNDIFEDYLTYLAQDFCMPNNPRLINREALYYQCGADLQRSCGREVTIDGQPLPAALTAPPCDNESSGARGEHFFQYFKNRGYSDTQIYRMMMLIAQGAVAVLRAAADCYADLSKYQLLQPYSDDIKTHYITIDGTRAVIRFVFGVYHLDPVTATHGPCLRRLDMQLVVDMESGRTWLSENISLWARLRRSFNL